MSNSVKARRFLVPDSALSEASCLTLLAVYDQEELLESWVC
jgi:hypothetical protein